MPLVILSLPLIAVCLYAWAVTYSSQQQGNANASWLGSILHYLRLAGDPGALLNTAAQLFSKAVANAAGKIAMEIDKPVAAQFHGLAHVVNQMGQSVASLGDFLVQLTETVAGKAGVGDIAGAILFLRHKLEVAIHTAETALNHEIAHAKALTRTVAHGVYPRIRALEHDVTKVIPREIKHARTLAREAEREATKAWKLAKSLERHLGKTAIAAAVATALAAIGLDWLACKNRSSVNGKSGCALWNDIEALLGAAFIAAEVASLDELIHVAQAVTEDVVKGVEVLLEV